MVPRPYRPRSIAHRVIIVTEIRPVMKVVLVVFLLMHMGQAQVRETVLVLMVSVLSSA
jgi:hypothetical protein